MRISVYKTTRVHRNIYTLLEELTKAGFKGIVSHSQYRGKQFPVVTLQDFSIAERSVDRKAGVFLGSTPIKVQSTGRFRTIIEPVGPFKMDKDELIAVWK